MRRDVEVSSARSASPDVLRGSQAAANAPIPAGFREMLTRLYAEPMRRFRDEYGIDYIGPGRD